jgi:maleylpyruvate isomerase
MTTAGPRYVLHNYWRSSASYRVRIALGLKGIAYEYRAINLIQAGGGAQHEPGYRALSPHGQVPTLEVHPSDGGPAWHLTQSLPIIEYLDDVHPGSPLLPQAARARALARAIAELINSGIQPLQNLATMAAVRNLGGDDRAWVQGFVASGLRALEQLVRASAGTCAVADHPTIADCALVPQLYAARRFDVALDGCPTLLAVEAHLLATYPAVAAAHPDRQPDAAPSPAAR